MKRSEINRYISDALIFWEGLGFRMPPFADSALRIGSRGQQTAKKFLIYNWDGMSPASAAAIFCSVACSSLPFVTAWQALKNILSPMQKRS